MYFRFSGKRTARLVRSTFDSDFEELRLLYSQSAFSPDGQTLAVTGQRHGKDVLYLFDVHSRKQIKRFDLPLETVTSPAWSPDGEFILFASTRLGFKDEMTYTDAPQPYGEIFVMRYDGTNVQQLTDNQWEDGTPAWQPRARARTSSSER